MTYRVVSWSSGNVGKYVIGSVARRANMDLVGVWVHSPDKVGVDAGTLVGKDPIGVKTTNDVEALLDLKPDCVCYTAQGEEFGDRAIVEMARILEAGINVVTSSSYSLIHPSSMPPDWREVLEKAAVKGGATAYSTGIEPGFVDDQLSVVLTMMADKIDSIRIQEFADYNLYNAREALEGMGFAVPMDTPSVYDKPGHLTSVWGGVIRLLAERLNLKLDGFRETYQRFPAPRDLDVAFGTLKQGTTGAIRFETIGVVNGRDTIIVEHINRMAADLAPEWPSAARGESYRVTIEGEPRITCDLTFGPPNHGLFVHAMLLVNAIPYVCDAKPGLVTTEDLPIAIPDLS